MGCEFMLCGPKRRWFAQFSMKLYIRQNLLEKCVIISSKNLDIRIRETGSYFLLNSSLREEKGKKTAIQSCSINAIVSIVHLHLVILSRALSILIQVGSYLPAQSYLSDTRYIDQGFKNLLSVTTALSTILRCLWT